jgi:hypothetical protein
MTAITNLFSSGLGTSSGTGTLSVSSSGMRSVGSTKHKQATLVSSLFHTVDTGICKEVQGLSAWTEVGVKSERSQ